VELLVQEVEDLLPAGRVGLYEFMWILNSEQVDGTREEHRRIAMQALDRLLEVDGSRLTTEIWARPDTEQDLGRDVQPDDFNDPGEDPYVAITRD
jgi:hypothetical protein